MRKSPDAFRTISEVAQELDLPQHVLRFWETRFSQIKPMKRGGGRRYYRPDDVELLRGIRHLLYGEGYTIKGVQRILKEQGVRHVIEAFPGHVSMSETGIEPSDGQIEVGSGDVQAGQPIAAPSQNEPLTTQLHPQGIATGNAAPLVESKEPVQQPAPVQHPMPAVSVPAAQISISQPQAPHSSVNQVEPSVVSSESDAASTIPTPPAVEVQNPVAPAIGQMDAVNRQQSEAVLHETVVQSATMTPPAPLNQPLSAPTLHSEEAPLLAQTGQLENQSQNLNNSTAPASIMAPHVTQPTPMPQDLSQGEPVYRQGQEAAFSVEAGRNNLLQENKSGFFSRLRGKNATDDVPAPQETGASVGMPRDDVRRLQSTLFELLECKRILDQARNSS